MGEFALRGYNVALPEVDKGDDIFVVNDATGSLWRVQVKTSCEKRQKKSSRYGFRTRKASVTTIPVPDIAFVFVMRHKEIWRFCVIARAQLETYRAAGHLTESRDPKTGIDFLQASLVLHDDGKALLAKQDVAKHMEDWTAWPVI